MVWARDLGPGENARLLECFRGRVVWRVDTNVAEPCAVAEQAAKR
jgi:hypothetical protein